MLLVKVRVIVLVLFCWVSLIDKVYSQDSLRIEVLLKGGLSLPIAAFSNQDFSNSINVLEGTPRAGAFYKQGNGYANNGIFWALDASYRFEKKLKLGFGFYYTSNSVDIGDAVEYYLTNFGRDGGEHEPYQVFSSIAHAGYIFSFGRLELVPKLMVGLGHLKFPDYRFAFSFDRPSPYWGHDGEQQRSNALVLGGGLSFTYWVVKRIGISTELDFLAANFDYSMDLRMIPGGSGSMPVNDRINYRILPVSMGLSFKF